MRLHEPNVDIHAVDIHPNIHANIHSNIHSGIQIVSDIDYTISHPKNKEQGFLADCLTDIHHHCPIWEEKRYFAKSGSKCTPQCNDTHHLSMSCQYRHAFCDTFYDWLATLDMQHDTLIEPTARFISLFDPPPIFLTNRDEQVWDKTVHFFSKHSISFHALHMRKRGDYRPLWAFKTEKIAELATQFESIIWLDDQVPPCVPKNVTWYHPDSLPKLHSFFAAQL